MSFVTLGGDGATRPTFFELVAAERLMPSLKAAISYSVSVLAQHRPWLHRVLDYEDECFALVCATLDKQSLASSSATFAESLYGLRRATSTRRLRTGPSKDQLSSRQQQYTVLTTVGLCYLSSKLHTLFQRHKTHVDTELGLTIVRRSSAQAAVGSTWRQALLHFFVRVYPWIHACQEGLRFGYQLLYLLENSAYFSPAQQLLGQRIMRVTGSELNEAERHRQDIRKRQLHQAALHHWPTSLLHRLLLQTSYVLSDHTRNALILSVFGFKLLEWWYVSGEEKLAARKHHPPPPPPAAPLPAQGGVSLPHDPSVCPLCHNKRTNPAMAVVSGYVFCYPCLFRHVSQSGCCPVTRIPMTIDQMRRLYQSA